MDDIAKKLEASRKLLEKLDIYQLQHGKLGIDRPTERALLNFLEELEKAGCLRKTPQEIYEIDPTIPGQHLFYEALRPIADKQIERAGTQAKTFPWRWEQEGEFYFLLKEDLSEAQISVLHKLFYSRGVEYARAQNNMPVFIVREKPSPEIAPDIRNPFYTELLEVIRPAPKLASKILKAFILTTPTVLQWTQAHSNAQGPHSEVVRVFTPRASAAFTQEDRELLLSQAQEAGIILPMGKDEKTGMSRFVCMGALVEAIHEQLENVRRQKH